MVSHMAANLEAMEVIGGRDIIGRPQHIIRENHIIIIIGKSILSVENLLHTPIIIIAGMCTTKA